MTDINDEAVVPFINPKLTMEWLRENATGKKVQVAVLDSGIDSWHSQLLGKIKRSCIVSKTSAGSIGIEEIPVEKSTDSFGHGTAVAGCITSIASDVEITNIKVLNDFNSCTGDILIAGLKWALDNKIRLINMSLATSKQQWAGDLRQLSEQAYVDNSIIVASRRNQGGLGFPASFSSVISVDTQSFDSRFSFNYKKNSMIECDAQGNQIKVLAPGDKFAIQSGTSFATPHITGMVALLLQVYPSLSAPEAKSILNALSKNSRL